MKFIHLIFFWSFCSFSQTNYPRDYFRSPLDIPIQLSGNFGELRPNHFHAGLDFKTQKKEGLNVYAAAAGYVSRIKIAHGGYGKAIYITHPNGFTTVYGHLKCAVGSIEKYINKEQYKAKSYEIEVILVPNQLMVNKGDIIALSGNTGGSDGPHLHFEFRDTQSEKIINPMFFGFDKLVADTKRPIVTSLMVYPMDENSTVNQAQRPISVNLSLLDDGSYIAEKVLASGKIGFGITSIDLDNVSWNANGVYKVQTFLNGKPSFGYQFDTFPFDESRYINAFIDYTRYKKLGQRVQKLFMKNPYPLSLIKTNTENGIISVLPNMNQMYRIEISDFIENCTKISVPIQFSNLPPKVAEEPITSKYFIKSKRENSFSLENVSVFFPANTFYDDFYMNFNVKNGTLYLHDDTVAAHSGFSITFDDSTATENEREKMFIASVYEKKIYFNTTKRKNTTFTTYTKYLGQYSLMKDTIAPKITISKSIDNKWISNQKELQLTISDDLSGIKTYNGYLNGNWILFEYESKTKKITHSFADGIVADGKNDLKVVVTDNVGNSTIFETQFFRSQKP
jgi:murein DD-endopeptidase MepM/ murein hydrolase activator NlpD